MAERLISEAITPVGDAYDTSAMAVGEPGLPREFKWGNQIFEVAAVRRTWRETGKCYHGSPERYVRKHWFEITTTTTGNETMKIYFERQPRTKRKSSRWWLFSVTKSEDGSPKI